MRTFARLAALLTLPALAALAGCGNSTAPAMGTPVEVKGTVTLADGRPMKAGSIHFEPDGEGREEMAAVKDGAFELTMFVDRYKVAFDMNSRNPSSPARYSKFASSGLTAEVKTGMEPLKFELK